MTILRQKSVWTIAMLVTVAAMVVTLWAQEPQQINRPLAVTQGNVTISRGTVVAGGGIVRDYRTASAISADSAQTYTAANVITGWIQRSGITTNRIDTLPTAANLAAALPGVLAGGSLEFILQNSSTAATGGTLILNGASTGVTYSESCSAKLDTSGVMRVRIVFTSTTAYTALCTA